MVILPDDLGEASFTEQVKAIKLLITEREGEITHEDLWGLHEFCYRIKKYDAGYYFVLNFKLPGSKLSDLNKNLRLNTSILRFLITTTPPNYKTVNFKQDQEKLGLNILPRDLYDVDRPHKKRKDKFGPDRKPATAPPRPKIAGKPITAPRPEPIKPKTAETPALEASSNVSKETTAAKAEDTAVKLVADLEEESVVAGLAPAKENPPASEQSKTDKAKKDDTEERLAALDKKLEKLLNEDL